MTRYEIVEACQIGRRSSRKFPLLIQFAPGCKPNNDNDIISNNDKNHEEDLLKFVKYPNKSQVLLKGQIGKRKYIALEGEEEKEGEKNMKDELGSQYMFGIVNEKTKSLKLVQVAGEYLLKPAEVIQPLVKYYDSDKVVEDQVSSSKKVKYRELKNNLIEGLGGRKARIAQERRNKIDDDVVGNLEMKDVKLLDTVLDERRKADKDGGHEIDNTSQYLVPPHNVNATNVEDAYPLEGLLDYHILELLYQEAEEGIKWIESGKSNEDPSYTNLSWQLMKHAVTQSSQNDTELHHVSIRKRVVAALYLHYLIVFARAPQKFGKREAEMFLKETYAPNEVSENMLELFAEKGAKLGMYVKTRETKDKLLYYAMIMWLTACNFKAMHLPEIVAAFELKAKDCFLYLKYLGCSIRRLKKGTDVGYKISLTVPLKFPVLKRRMGRKARR